MAIIRKLEKRAALQILLYLLNGGASRTDLRKNIDASVDAIYSALSILLKLGLIKEETLEKFPFSVVVKLTEKGRRIAALLAEIEKILEGL